VPVTDWINGNRLGIRRGSIVVPVTGQCTTEAITMSVNPVTGVSPVTGTTVTNQAEYNALGNPLRYAQDALDILPLALGSYVLVYLEDGEHLAKLGNYRETPARSVWLNMSKSFQSIAPRVLFPSLSSPLVMKTSVKQAIYFVGRNSTVIKTAQAGTVDATSTFITRTTGSDWTIDEFKGKQVKITSGALTDYLMPIVGNTATILEVPYHYGPTAGATTFEIVTPSAIALDSVDGVTSSAWGVFQMDNVFLNISFSNIQFGKPTLGAVQSTIRKGIGQISIKYCTYIAAQDSIGFYHYNVAEGGSSCSLVFSGTSFLYMGTKSANFYQSYGPVNAYISGCFFDINNGANGESAINVGSNGYIVFSMSTVLDSSNSTAKGCISLYPGPVEMGYIKYVSKNVGTGFMIKAYFNFGINNSLILTNTLVCVNAYAVAVVEGGANLQVGGAGVFSGCSGNSYGAILSGSSKLGLRSPANLGGTVNAFIDGEAFTWASDFPAAGDSVIGTNSSELLRLL
jgi:hypothetical protein